MPYFFLLLFIVMGFMLNRIWEGVILGILLWWLRHQISKEHTIIDNLQKQLETTQNEVSSLQARVQYLEQNTLPAATPSVILPTLSNKIEEASAPELSTITSNHVTETSVTPPPISSLSSPTITSRLPSETVQHKTISIRKRLQKQARKQSSVFQSTLQTGDKQEQYKVNLSNLSNLLNWLTSGNWLLKTGMLILFLGLAFLLRLTAERIEVPIEIRYIMVALAGIMATLMGWRLQNKQREYALMLQGFGIAILYLTALAALKLHPLLPASATFVAMVSLVVLMTVIAVRQNALPLAQVALVGGMAAPILVSEGNGHYLVLFTYLALLNTGIASIAWFKAWRSLNLVGFIGTFTIGAIWGAKAYTSAHFLSTEPFLLYHWLLYTVIVCLFARQQLVEQQKASGQNIPDDASISQILQTIRDSVGRVGILDSTLLFGTALAAFGLQYQMVANWQYAAAGSAMGFAVVYALFALWISRWDADFIVLKQAFIGLASLFIILAIPLALEQQWTASVWALQAALVYVFAIRQQLPLSRLLALGVFALAVLMQLDTYQIGEHTLLTGSLLGTILASGGGAAIYGMWWQLRRIGSAVWEEKAQTGVLLLTVILTSFIPMLLWAERGSMLAIAILSIMWSYIQRKYSQWVFSMAVMVSSLWVLLWAMNIYWDDITYGSPHSYGWLLCSALSLGMAAFFLQQSRVLKVMSMNRIISWCLLGITVVLSMAGVQQSLSIMAAAYEMDLYDKRWLMWTPFGAFAPLVALANRLQWQQAQRISLAFLPVLTLWFLMQNLDGTLLVSGVLLIATTLLQYYVLSQQTGQPDGLLKSHFLGLVLLGVVWTKWAVHFAETYFTGVWVQLAWVMVPMLIGYGLQKGRKWFTGQTYEIAYWRWGSTVAAGYVLVWLLYMNMTTPFAPYPLPYVPLLNPLELVMLGVLYHGHRWLRIGLPKEDSVEMPLHVLVLLVLGFITLSASVMRAWHFLDGVIWDFSTLLASFGLQASLSIVWAITAIALMVTGNQTGQRNRWLLGATLIGVVVVKLFLVELSNSGGIARIVSFIVVGLLLLLVGWFAPAPPKKIDK